MGVLVRKDLSLRQPPALFKRSRPVNTEDQSERNPMCIRILAIF